MKPIHRAIEHLGQGQSGFARAIGAHPQQVQQWLYDKRPVPLERCPRVETVTDGTVRCEDLRPDVDWQRDGTGRVTGYQVQFVAPAKGRAGKQVGGDVSSSHGAAASRKATSLKTPRVKGRQGETVHG